MLAHEPTTNKYVIDIEQGAETARLMHQDRLFTEAMGGLFPELPDLSTVTRVLDLGCGPGQWVIDVAFQFPNMQVAGIDINQTMIEYARANAWSRGLNNATFRQMDATRSLDFPTGSFDLVNARFIVGFMDQISWPKLLSECQRVLTPGGIIRLTECEMAISNSAALQALFGSLAQALSQQGRSFSVDGCTIGIAHMLGTLLQRAGFERLERRPFCLDASYGSRLHHQNVVEAQVTFHLLKPYLIRSGIVDEATFDERYRQMLEDMLFEDFVSLSFGVTTWGRKPACKSLTLPGEEVPNEQYLLRTSKGIDCLAGGTVPYACSFLPGSIVTL